MAVFLLFDHLINLSDVIGEDSFTITVAMNQKLSFSQQLLEQTIFLVLATVAFAAFNDYDVNGILVI